MVNDDLCLCKSGVEMCSDMWLVKMLCCVVFVVEGEDGWLYFGLVGS